MAKRKRADTGTDLVFEAQLWKAADALRSNMDAAQYKHVPLRAMPANEHQSTLGA